MWHPICFATLVEAKGTLTSGWARVLWHQGEEIRIP